MANNELVTRVSRALLALQRHSWEQGTAAQAFLELGESDLVVAMAYAAVLRQLPDGRLGMIGDYNATTDPAASGEAVLYAARATADAKLHAAVEAQAEWLLHKAPRTADGTLYHHTDDRQVWIDALYMAPPFLAVAGYPQEAVRQFDGFRKYLWDGEKKLYHHIWDDLNARFRRAAFWGVGNGWAAAGLTRVIRALPEALVAERARLILYVREVVEGCLAYLRPDGLFHDVVDDPTTFVETNLSQIMAYVIYRGVKGGWLDASYLAPAARMRAAAHAKVDASGYVQGVCGAPHFDRPGIAPEGQAFFLLMEAAARDAGL